MTQEKEHWAEQQERGNRFVLGLTRYLVRFFPTFLMHPIVWCVVLYYYLSSKSARTNIIEYQRNLAVTFPELESLTKQKYSVIRQFHAFAISIVDRFSVWQKKITYEDLIIHDPDDLYADMDEPALGSAGQIFIVSHLGNIEICRALVKKHPDFILNVLIHHKHAEMFNEALADAGASRIRLIQVTELDVDMMMQLSQRIAAGEWLAIAADRIPVRGEKAVAVEFLGQMAQWPQGPWLMASLLKVPVNTLFCLKEKGQYNLYLNRFSETIVCSRKQRESAITAYASRYAQLLEQQCRNHSLQWFNFYSFWGQVNNERSKTEA